MTRGFGLIGILISMAILAVLASTVLVMMNRSVGLGDDSDNVLNMVNKTKELKEVIENRNKELEQDLGAKVQIQNEFDNKVVYTANANADQESLKADCQKRGGTFNECGSVCPSESDMCIDVCAFTCEL